jgi:hypothetical protein
MIASSGLLPGLIWTFSHVPIGRAGLHGERKPGNLGHHMTKKTWRHKIRQITVMENFAFIPLTRGKTAVIDADDIDLVKGWNWCAMPVTNGAGWYAYNAGNRKLRLHQVILPAPKGLMTDHRDRNGLNCRRSNLRFATALGNSRNRFRSGVSGFKGVGRRNYSGLWRARITVDGKRMHLGDWPTAEDAARAYDKAANKFFGKFAFLNFPDKFAKERIDG